MDFLINLRNLLCCVRETLGYVLIFLWAIFRPKAVLAAKLLAVQSRLSVCKHRIGSQKHPQLRFTASFRLLLVVLSKFLDKSEDLVRASCCNPAEPFTIIGLPSNITSLSGFDSNVTLGCNFSGGQLPTV